MRTVNELIKDINALKSNLHEKDFLLTWEQSPEELKLVLDLAEALKTMRAENIATKIFNSGLGISVFRDNSTRTRFSYASALNLLGLTQQDLDEGKSQIAHGETVRETANMISFCADAIGIRDDMYLGRVTLICVKLALHWMKATSKVYCRSVQRWLTCNVISTTQRSQWPIWLGCRNILVVSKI
jgi:ornithine carbamoyltransferase